MMFFEGVKASEGFNCIVIYIKLILMQGTLYFVNLIHWHLLKKDESN